jgi:hypothetical protein
MALRGNRLGFRQVCMQGSHAGSISSQRTYGNGRSTWMPTPYDPNEHAAVLRGWPTADWLQAHRWLGQDREDGITIATPRPQDLRMRLASARISKRRRTRVARVEPR